MKLEEKQTHSYTPSHGLSSNHVEPTHNDSSGDNWDNLVTAGGERPDDPTGAKGKGNKKDKKAETPMLDAYGISINQAVRDGKLDPVYGRDKEILRIAQILCRKKKNNPLLLGDPGVGKTAIIEALAQRIESHKVPVTLLDKTIISLDLASLVAGSMYRGQFEERLKKLMNELEDRPDIILYIDEIHTIMGSGNPEGGLDAANILKPALARGDIRCIGATTLSEYRKSIEKDGAMDRRFQKVMIQAPDEAETFKILENLKSTYEKHHNVKYTTEALEACVKLTARYVSDRHFPDKAIDAMDEAGAYTFMSHQAEPTKLQEIEERIKKASASKAKAVKELNYELATRYRDEEQHYRDEMDNYINDLKSGHYANGEERTVIIVGRDEVERVVALTSGIPVESLTRDDMESLSGLGDRLKSRVIGQDHVVNEVASAIQRNKVGLRDPKRPIGTFLFLGSSGVGKTHLSKQIARELFGSEDALIRIDMSEFMERHTVSRLIGAPPGYVGYDEGGELTEKVLRRPYSVVLFDEIEKANPQVHNLLLQIMDDGILTDSNGKTVNFKNTIIIMTSNVGTRQLKEFGGGIGFKDYDKFNLSNVAESVITKALQRTFPPEFINRIDKVLTFNPLQKQDILKIVDLELNELFNRLKGLNLKVELTEEAKKFIAKEGYDPQFGARPIKRAIARYVEKIITQAVIDGMFKTGETYLIDIDKEADSKEPGLKLLQPELVH